MTSKPSDARVMTGKYQHMGLSDVKPPVMIKVDGSADGILFIHRKDGGREIRIRDGCKVLQYELEDEDVRAIMEWSR